MDLSYEFCDWFLRNTLWILIGMITVVMTVGPWLLRRQIKKATKLPIQFKQTLLPCFLAGLASIIVFIACGMILALFAAAVLENLPIKKEWRDFLTPVIIVVILVVYFTALHVIVVFLVKQKVPQDTKKWVGWHLTVMCGLCTIVCYICFASIQRHVEFQIFYTSKMDVIQRSLEMYLGDDKTNYPNDLGVLVNEGLFSNNHFMTPKTDILYKEVTNFKAPTYVHFFKLPPDASNGLLWIWMDADQYDFPGMPVAIYGQKVKWIDKKELPALIERSQKWLAEHPQVKEQPAKK